MSPSSDADLPAAERVSALAPWPDEWEPLGDTSTYRGWRGFGWFLLAVSIVGVVIVLVQRPVSMIALVLLGLVAAAALGCLGLAALLSPARGSVEFRNAVTLTDASSAPADSWVHFVRDRPRTMLIGAGFVVAGLVLLALPVAAYASGQRGDAPNVVALILGLAMSLAIGLAGVIGGARLMLGGWRMRSFGRIPNGVAFGPSGLMIVTVDGADVLPWSRVAGAAAIRLDAADTRKARSLSVIEVRTREPGGKVGRRRFMPGAYQVPEIVMWTALSTFANDRDTRAVLGTTEGQGRFEDWVAAARAA